MAQHGNKITLYAFGIGAESVCVFKIKLCIFKRAPESGGEDFLGLREKVTAFFDVAIGSFCRDPVLFIYESGDTFMNCLILKRQIVIIFVVRKKIAERTVPER